MKIIIIICQDNFAKDKVQVATIPRRLRMDTSRSFNHMLFTVAIRDLNCLDSQSDNVKTAIGQAVLLNVGFPVSFVFSLSRSFDVIMKINQYLSNTTRNSSRINYWSVVVSV